LHKSFAKIVTLSHLLAAVAHRNIRSSAAKARKLHPKQAHALETHEE
jgi:hypothetical protein